jgi:signal transduction histidine kinase
MTSRKEHEVSVHFPSEPVWIDGDPVRLEQIFCNLLNNAAKYTGDRGRISLTVCYDDTFVAIHIRDSGIGIPPEMLSRSLIFSRSSMFHSTAPKVVWDWADTRAQPRAASRRNR